MATNLVGAISYILSLFGLIDFMKRELNIPLLIGAVTSIILYIILKSLNKSNTDKDSSKLRRRKIMTRILLIVSSLYLGYVYFSFEEPVSSNPSNQFNQEQHRLPVIGKPATDQFGEPFVSANRDIVQKNYISLWNIEEDRDIKGNTYDNAIKFTSYNMIDKLFEDSNNSSSTYKASLNLPYGKKAKGLLNVKIVVANEMVGNGSYADIAVYKVVNKDIQKVLSPGTIDSNSVNDIEFSVNVTNVDNLIIEFNCYTVGSGIVVGIVLG